MNMRTGMKMLPTSGLLKCLVILIFGFIACKEQNTQKEENIPSILNLTHLDNLGEVVNYSGEEIRMIHIYAEAPDYDWVGDSDEGVACVDDVARAAVVYLRHYELTNDEESAEKAKQLLRFILYMQNGEGLFNNFVWDNTLRKNTTHQNSVADKMNWWAARAVWALGTGAKVLADYDSAFAQVCLTSIDKAMPHVEKVLQKYPSKKYVNSYEMPTWLIGETGSDASSELLLGLAAANKASPDQSYSDAINKLSEGISLMQYGDIGNAPYGAHMSWQGGWHGWGNSQTMALLDAGKSESAIVEGSNFYPWLLVNGWIHSFELSNPENPRYFEQIAYATRTVSVGLVRLYEETGNEDFAIMAGLAASWFNGNNVADTKMYNSLYGYGYDGINNANTINKNSGAESTIEANMTVLEIEQYPLSKKWFYADSEDPEDLQKDGNNYRYRIFTVKNNGKTERAGLILNLEEPSFEILKDPELQEFISQN